MPEAVPEISTASAEGDLDAGQLAAAQSAAEAQEQIAQLTVMAARGDLDLDALPVLTRSLTLSIDTRLEVLEERLGEREREASYET